MTPSQQAALDIVNDVNENHFDGWFLASSVMTVIQIESNFIPSARRYEPRIHDASYGLMQLLSKTAKGIGYNGPVYPDMPSPSDTAHHSGTLYDPAINIFYGMTYLRNGWDYLHKYTMAAQPTLAVWFAGYNEGYGAAARGRPDPLYSDKAITVFETWLDQLDERSRAVSLIRS